MLKQQRKLGKSAIKYRSQKDLNYKYMSAMKLLNSLKVRVPSIKKQLNYYRKKMNNLKIILMNFNKKILIWRID